MSLRTVFTTLIILFLHLSVFSQETTVFTEANLDFKRGKDFFDKGLFGQAMQEFSKVLIKLPAVGEPESDLLRTKAELNKAKSAVRLELPDGEKMMLDFIRKHRPDPMANEALIDVANYYFNARKYDKANEFYQLVPLGQLPSSKKAEVKFKIGYGYFVRKDFEKAKANFYHIKQVPSLDYYMPANYYYGLCEFFESDYREATRSFQIVQNDKRYSKHIPYYLAQIYFAQGEYDKIIRQVEPKLISGGLRNEDELHGLVGQSYFEKGDYKRALPHLEEYATGTNKLREEEFYQLGYTQYKTGHYKEASTNFKELARSNTPLGQQSMYLLGDCYLRTGSKENARTAFGVASKMSFDVKTGEDAAINYAKLSYELNHDADALSALQSIRSNSTYYNEAQELMSDLFLNSSDYSRALAVIEKIPNKTPKIREAYQKVSYMRALELYKAGDKSAARGLLSKSIQVPINQEYKALATYWSGRIAYDEKDYSTAIDYMNRFNTMAKGMNNFPDEASPSMANYLLGYCYLKQKQFNTAQGYFQDAVAGIKRNINLLSNDAVKSDVLGDALLRAGDCLFKRNKYPSAIKFYDEAINGRYKDYVYAIYQKATIEGLRGNQTEKILALEKIEKNHANSDYADDALLELGKVYLEINNLNQATKPLKKLIKNYSSSPLVNQALIKLGLISYNQGNRQVAINYYKQVFAKNPTSAEASSAKKALEEIYVRDLGKPDEYFAFLETIPGYDVDSNERDNINFEAAETQYENGNYARAVSGYDSYISKYPNGANRLLAQYHRGQSYYALKKYTNALRDFEYVVQKGQSRYYTDAVESAALITYNHEEDFAKAYKYYTLLEQNANNDKQRFEGQLGAMRAAYRAGNKSAAVELARKVASNSKASNVQKGTANLYIGKDAMDKKSFDVAKRAFQQVARFSDDEGKAEALYNLGYIEYVERNLETALELCQTAQQETGAYPYWQGKATLLMADIYTERGEFLNAQAILEVILERYKQFDDLQRDARNKKAKLDKMIDAQSRLDVTTPGQPLELIDGN